MIQSVNCIAITLTTSLPLWIILIGPLVGEKGLLNSKMRTKCAPSRQERVKILFYLSTFCRLGRFCQVALFSIGAPFIFRLCFGMVCQCDCCHLVLIGGIIGKEVLDLGSNFARRKVTPRDQKLTELPTGPHLDILCKQPKWPNSL